MYAAVSSFRCYRYCMIVYLATGLLAGRVVAQDSLVAFVFLREDCVICQEYMPYLQQLQLEYAQKGITFIGLFPNHSSDWADIGAFRDKYHPSFPLKADPNQAMARQLGATVTPEVVLYQPQSGQILYRGRIDNRYAQVGKRRRAGITSDLAAALEQWARTAQCTQPAQAAIGCLITFDPPE